MRLAASSSERSRFSQQCNRRCCSPARVRAVAGQLHANRFCSVFTVLAKDSPMVFLHDSVTGAETLPRALFCPIPVGRLCRLARARLVLFFRDLENDDVSLTPGSDHQSAASLFPHPL